MTHGGSTTARCSYSIGSMQFAVALFVVAIFRENGRAVGTLDWLMIIMSILYLSENYA